MAACVVKTFARCLLLMLTVREALGGSLGLGDIGKAFRAVSKDPPKMLQAVEQRLGQGDEGPERLVGDARQALAGADASKALDTAGGAAQSVSGALPAASAAVSGGRARARPGQSTTAEPPGGGEAGGSRAVQDALGEVLRGRDVEGAVGRMIPGSVAAAVAKVRGGGIEEAASTVSELGQKIADVQVRAAGGSATTGSAVSQAVGQAEQALEGKTARVGSLAEKATTATAKEVMDLAGAESSKKLGRSIWGDLQNAVPRVDATIASANSAHTSQNIGKKELRSPTDEAASEHGEAGVDGNVSLVVLLALAGCILGFILGAYVFFQRVAKPRPVGMAMLSGDHEQGNTAAASHWMGTSARDLVPNSPGGNDVPISRDAVSNLEWLSRS